MDELRTAASGIWMYGLGHNDDSLFAFYHAKAPVRITLQFVACFDPNCSITHLELWCRGWFSIVCPRLCRKTPETFGDIKTGLYQSHALR
ncbi:MULTISPECIES: hypothetical protein [unclassified Ruegeria]|uniref:hypothetical protein n=1 Tax=unclassified Ruegeria TaxID=2625375 RepID=UPI001489730A|nr:MULTISPECIES: hypothetical protein [unclassified Ruegeria]